MFVSADHTRLTSRENKLYEFGGYALPGVSVERLIVGGAAGLVVTAVIGVALKLFAPPGVWLLAVPVGCLAGIVGYFVARRGEGLSVIQRLVIAVDYWIFQPRRIAGFARDREPTMLHWQAIVWCPTDQTWLEERRLRVNHALADIGPIPDRFSTVIRLITIRAALQRTTSTSESATTGGPS